MICLKSWWCLGRLFFGTPTKRKHQHTVSGRNPAPPWVYTNYWLVVEPTPLKNDGVRQWEG